MIYSCDQFKEIFKEHDVFVFALGGVELSFSDDRKLTRIKKEYSESRISLDVMIAQVFDCVLAEIGKSVDSFEMTDIYSVVFKENPVVISIKTQGKILIKTRVQDLRISLASIYYQLGASAEKIHVIGVKELQSVFIPLAQDHFKLHSQNGISCNSQTAVRFLTQNIPLHQDVSLEIDIIGNFLFKFGADTRETGRPLGVFIKSEQPFSLIFRWNPSSRR